MTSSALEAALKEVCGRFWASSAGNNRPQASAALFASKTVLTVLKSVLEECVGGRTPTSVVHRDQ